MERFFKSAAFLRIRVPFDEETLRRGARDLVMREGFSEAFLRIHLSRGVGRRGYSPRGADSPCVVMTAHSMALADSGKPVSWALVTSSVRLPQGDALGNHKSSSKLPQVYARMEADAADADEARCVLDSAGHVAEGASSNVFWIRGNTVHTPPLATGALAGVTRRWVQEYCAESGRPCIETTIGIRDLLESDAVFVTVSSLGVVPVRSLDARPLKQCPLLEELKSAFLQALAAVRKQP